MKWNKGLLLVPEARVVAGKENYFRLLSTTVVLLPDKTICDIYKKINEITTDNIVLKFSIVLLQKIVLRK